MRIRLLIADDHQMFAEALKNLLETERDIEVAACVTTPDALADALKSQIFDVALLDLYFGQRHMLDDLAQLRKSAPTTKWAIITGFARVEDSLKALNLGCLGYIDKIHPAARVIDAVRRIHAGQIVTLISGKSSGSPDVAPKATPQTTAPELTPVQKKVLCMKVQGLKIQKIAAACGKSEPWVYIVLRELKDLLDAPNQHALVANALKLGICDHFKND